jgi:hypothetical protein
MLSAYFLADCYGEELVMEKIRLLYFPSNLTMKMKGRKRVHLH